MELFHLKNMQKKFMFLFTFMLLRVVYIYGTITGRKGTSTGYEEKILMPGVHPSVEDQYLCIGKKLDPADQYITSFEALANSTSIHHLLLYGCKAPYSVSGGWWKCGAICSHGGPSILYAWAKNAPPVNMPPNVGFHVGGKTSVLSIVLQIHYKHPIEKSRPGDRSGVKLTMTTKPQKFIAGIFIMMRYYFTIPSHSSGVHSDISCRYKGNSKLYPFAFRVHAHSLGRVISAYQYNDTGWHKLGKGNPQWPQAFYPINENLVIKPGDRLAARCTFDASNRDTDTHIGSTHNDEMCNFYLMYYTPANIGASYFTCDDDSIPRLSDKLPDESDSPLPPNPLLENWASGILSSAPKYVENWPKSKVKMGQISGIGTDSKGNIHIFHRGDRSWDENAFNNDHVLFKKTPIKDATVVVFDPDGNMLRSWGSNIFYMPHGLHIDKDDNVWLTDVGSHQVFKFPPNSATPSLILGTKLIPGSDSKHFCKPADVVTLSSGEFFVADGYCNSRIIKYNAKGEIITQWGENLDSREQVDEEGYPAPNKFLVPHSLAVNEGANVLYVADRENGRITAFNFQGNYIFQSHPKEFDGTLFSVAYDKNTGLIYAVNGPDSYKKVTVKGFILDSVTGKLLNTWSSPQGFSQPHDITVNKNGTCLYVSEIGPNLLYKFNLGNSDKTLKLLSHVRYDKTELPLTRTGEQVTKFDPQKRIDRTQDNLEEHIIDILMEKYVKKDDELQKLLNTAGESEEFQIVFNEILKLLAEEDSRTTEIPSLGIDKNNKNFSLAIRTKLQKILTTYNETNMSNVSAGNDMFVVTNHLVGQTSIKQDVTTPFVPQEALSEEKDDDMKASIIIGSLLLIPVLIIVMVVVILRLKRSGKISYIDATASFGKINKNRRNFNIGQIFNRHKGFDRLSQEDGELDHLNSDSEVEDYSTTEQKA